MQSNKEGKHSIIVSPTWFVSVLHLEFLRKSMFVDMLILKDMSLRDIVRLDTGG